jgi:hypothetical protein
MEILLREGLARLETSFRAEKKALPGTLVLEDSSLLENVANHTCICATVQIFVCGDQRIGCVGEGGPAVYQEVMRYYQLVRRLSANGCAELPQAGRPDFSVVVHVMIDVLGVFLCAV